MPGAEPQVVFGLSPVWVASALFLLVYGVVMTERVNRAVVALLGAGLMITLGVLNQEAAIEGIDFNTLGLLVGMMVIVAVTRKSGLFQYLAIWSAKRVKAQPWGILVMLSLVTAFTSALLDNVTTVLLVTPVTLLITGELRINPYPYLFTEILASNIGGTATLIGDPPNIMIGSAVGLSFNDFVYHLTPAVVVILAVTLIAIYFIWGRRLHAAEEARHRVMSLRENEAITDQRLLQQALLVLGLVITGFVFSRTLHLEAATIALFGAALLLLVHNLGRNPEEQSADVHASFAEVEWVTIFFFVGLFVVVHGLDTTGVLKMLADRVLAVTGGNMGVTAMAILWGSAVLSAFVDNIPFVATMIPLIQSMAPAFGGEQALMPLWWSLSLGVCLGGNGTLIGASANLTVAGLAERAGVAFRFIPFLKVAFPLMLLSIVISSIYVYLRYLT
jgi:Na+/H+ antiporter NhaD/arsenite permease-like protein